MNPGLLSQANMKGDTPLHTASRTGCLGMVEQFISSSKALCYDIERIRENEPQDLLMVNQEGDTALHVAVRYGHLDVVELLVNADIELMLHMYNKANESPLYLAVERGFFAIANHILNKCPTCSHRGTKGMTALHAAVVRTHQGNVFAMVFSGIHVPISSITFSNMTFFQEWVVALQLNYYNSSCYNLRIVQESNMAIQFRCCH